MKNIIPMIVGFLSVSLPAFAEEPINKGDISEFSGSITRINVRDYSATPNDGISDYQGITDAINHDSVGCDSKHPRSTGV